MAHGRSRNEATNALSIFHNSDSFELLGRKMWWYEVWSYKLDRGDLVGCKLSILFDRSMFISSTGVHLLQIRMRPGDALVFSGSLLHRGLGNQGNTHRFFYYASFACGIDMNVESYRDWNVVSILLTYQQIKIYIKQFYLYLIAICTNYLQFATQIDFS